MRPINTDEGNENRSFRYVNQPSAAAEIFYTYLGTVLQYGYSSLQNLVQGIPQLAPKFLRGPAVPRVENSR